MRKKLLSIINEIRTSKGLSPLSNISEGVKLREELNFNSFDLAELTVKIEDEFGIDVFADGLVSTIGEILTKLEKN